MDWMDRAGNLWIDNPEKGLLVLYVWVWDLAKISYKIFIKPELFALIGSVITRSYTRQTKLRSHLVVSSNVILMKLRNWRFDQIWLDKKKHDSIWGFFRFNQIWLIFDIKLSRGLLKLLQENQITKTMSLYIVIS